MRTAQARQEVEIIGTVICGDSYFNEHRETAMEMIIALIKRHGRAFWQGRRLTRADTELHK